MTLRFALAGMLLAAPAAAQAMPVSTFLAKAHALQAKGPLALLSEDLTLLTNEIKANATEIKAENQAAEKAGKRKTYCTPAGGVAMTQNDILAAMEAVPPAKRRSTSTKDALRAHLARHYPCR
jgi:hypothetical protein